MLVPRGDRRAVLRAKRVQLAVVGAHEDGAVRGAILFGSQDDRLYCLEPDGHLRWSVELGGDVDSSPTLAADGTIFVGSDDRKLYALRAAAGAAAAQK